jgi:predicted transposase YdaD
MGRVEGVEKGRAEIARNALAKGLPLETVSEITGLDIETIRNFTQ